MATCICTIILPLLIHILHLLIFGGWNFNRSLTEVVSAILFILRALIELPRTVSVWPWRDWKIGPVSSSTICIWVYVSSTLIHFTSNMNGILVCRILRLLTILWSILELVMASRLWCIESRRNGFLYNQSSLILAPIVSKGCWVQAPSSARVYGLLFDHLIEDSVLISLNNSTVVSTDERIILMMASNIWIIFRSYKLCLHRICHWLVSMVTNLSGVLNAIWSNTADASRIDTSYSSIWMIVNTSWKLEITIFEEKNY